MMLRSNLLWLGVVAGFCGYLIATATSIRMVPEENNEEQAREILLSNLVLCPTSSANLSSSFVSSRRLELNEEEKVVPEASEMHLPLPDDPPSVSPSSLPSLSVRPSSVQTLRREPYREVWAIVTAYCPCVRCCGWFANGLTSIGADAWRRGVAADPDAIPYGTKVYIEGYGYGYIDDSGIAMRRAWSRRGILHLDVRMKYHWQARQWGRRLMTVRIYDVE